MGTYIYYLTLETDPPFKCLDTPEEVGLAKAGLSPLPLPAYAASAMLQVRSSEEDPRWDYDHQPVTMAEDIVWPSHIFGSRTKDEGGSFVSTDDSGRMSPKTKPRRKESLVSNSLLKCFVKSFGRIYHKKYTLLPADETEQNRSDLQHAVCMTLHERLHYAPVVMPKRVVDIGTGNGSWAIEFAEQHPTTQVIGIDLNWLSPTRVVPENCSFDIANAEEDWSFTEGVNFDFAFLRFLGWFTDWKKILTHMYDNLEPGGWVEVHEWVIEFKCANGSLKGTDLRKWNSLLQQGLVKMGKTIFHADAFVPMLRELGFDRIEQRRFGVPMNGWSSDSKYKKVGAMNVKNNMQAASPLSYATICEGLGWSRESTDELVDGMKRDMQNPKIHGYTTIMVTTAQKPFSPTSPMSDTRRTSNASAFSSASTTFSIDSSLSESSSLSRPRAPNPRWEYTNTLPM